MALPPRSKPALPFRELKDSLQKKHTHLENKIGTRPDSDWLVEKLVDLGLTPKLLFQALGNWNSLTTAQKDRLLRLLLAVVLVLAQRSFVFKYSEDET